MISIPELLKTPRVADSYVEYFQQVSSSLFLPDSDVPVEFTLEFIPEGARPGHCFRIGIRRTDGCLTKPVGRMEIQNETFLFDTLLAANMLKTFWSTTEFSSVSQMVLNILQRPDPFALPQQQLPNLFPDPDNPVPVRGYGTSIAMPASVLGIRDTAEIRLWVDRIPEKNPKRSLLRVWAEWPDTDDRHLFCQMGNVSLRKEPVPEEIMAAVCLSKDFSRRILILHDRWRTSQRQPSVSSTKEMILHPIPDDSPDSPSLGFFKKHRRRR